MVRGATFATDTTTACGLEPEERLLLAVLERAVADLTDPSPAVRAEAQAYFFSNHCADGVFSFDAICDYFQLSTDAVRYALRSRCVRATPRVNTPPAQRNDAPPVTASSALRLFPAGIPNHVDATSAPASATGRREVAPTTTELPPYTPLARDRSLLVLT